MFEPLLQGKYEQLDFYIFKKQVFVHRCRFQNKFAPTFMVNGQVTTSEGEAIKAIAAHIVDIYSTAAGIPRLPPWNDPANIAVLTLDDAVRRATTSMNRAKSTDPPPA